MWNIWRLCYVLELSLLWNMEEALLCSGAVPTVEHGGGSVMFWSCPYCGTWWRLSCVLVLSLLWNMEEALLCSGAVPTVEHGGGSVMFWSCPYCGTWRRLCCLLGLSLLWNMVEALLCSRAVPTVEHGGGSVMFWSCPYCGTWWRLCYVLELSLLWNMVEALLCSGAVPTVDIINSGYNEISRLPRTSRENVLPSVRKLGLSRRSWVLLQDNDPKHTSKNPRMAQRKHWTVLKWPSMSPDLNPTEHLWKELKPAVWKRHPSNLRQLEQFAHEEWARIPAERCRSLTDRYRNRLIAVTASKDDLESKYDDVTLNMIIAVVQAIGFSNSFNNPIVYAFMNENFKKSCVSTLSACLRRPRRLGGAPERLNLSVQFTKPLKRQAFMGNDLGNMEQNASSSRTSELPATNIRSPSISVGTSMPLGYRYTCRNTADGAVGVEVEGHQAFWTCVTTNRSYLGADHGGSPPHHGVRWASLHQDYSKAGLVTEDDPLPF
ncbi:hypothetical protein NFI96_001040 [Prochilodus magdalenae]|nr:hypothetical protein NFI96_001040 [Prochilodus magdalenae]